MTLEEAMDAYREWLAYPAAVALCAGCRCPWLAHHATGCVSCATACVHPELLPRGKAADLDAEMLTVEMLGGDTAN
jgi:hypothetical protein